MYVGDRMLFGVLDEITDMTRNSGPKVKIDMWIVVFDLRKGSGIHRKGFRMFPEMFGHENTLSGPKGKAHEVLESAKGSFAESRGQTPGSLASGPGVREGLLPFG